MSLDPKSAAKLGESLGKGLSDQVFGLVDDVRKAKATRAANDAKILQRNKITEINNEITRQNNALREQAMREIAAEQEASAMAKMTPAQRAAYKAQKQANADAAVRRAREQAESREAFWQYLWAAIIVLISVPLLGLGGWFLLKLAH